MLGAEGPREAAARIAGPCALALASVPPEPFALAGPGIASAPATLLVEAGEAERASGLHRGLLERLERGPGAGEAREVEFRGETIRVFEEKVAAPPRRRPRGGAGGAGAGGGDETVSVTRAVVLLGTLLAVAPTEEAARQIVLRRAGGETEGDPLSAATDFRAAFEPIEPGGDVRTFLASSRLAVPEGFGRVGAAEGGPRTARARAAVLRLGAEGIVEDSVALLGEGEARGGARAFLRAPEGPLPQPGYVPAEATDAALMRVSWTEMWSAMSRGFPGAGGPGAPDAGAALEERLGFNPERDFFGKLGDLVVTWEVLDAAEAEAAPAARGPRGRRSFAAGLRDGPAISGVLSKLAGREGSGLERVDFQGREIFVAKKGGGFGLPGLPIGPDSGLCVAGDLLISAGGGAQGVRDVIGRLDAEGSAFFGDEAWAALAARMPAALSGLHYAKRAAGRLSAGRGLPPGGMSPAESFLGVDMRCSGELVGARCDRALEGIVAGEDRIREVLAARWAPTEGKK
ncbi:MAG: hypothetical protein L0216_17895 [Planctomycetales bacterium]|nr:hypothetical protein [Planctomycetales bacterium]